MLHSPGSHARKKQLRTPLRRLNIWRWAIACIKLRGFTSSLERLVTISEQSRSLVTIKVLYLSCLTQPLRSALSTSIQYHYIREVIARGLVDVTYISGDDNPADLLTKNLGRVKFAKFLPFYGLQFHNAYQPKQQANRASKRTYTHTMSRTSLRGGVLNT